MTLEDLMLNATNPVMDAVVQDQLEIIIRQNEVLLGRFEGVFWLVLAVLLFAFVRKVTR